MNGYILNFIVYLMAMLGFITLAVFVYKKSLNFNTEQTDKNFLKVENSLRLNASKTIYVIKAGNEKFLIAADAANTTMLSKLNSNNSYENINEEMMSNNVKEFNSIQKCPKKISR